MKYCSNCGHPMEDHARYCSNCGERTTDPIDLTRTEMDQTTEEWNYGENTFVDVQNTSSTVDRKGMRIACWSVAILGIFSMVMAFTDDYSMMAMVAFCLPLAGMFYILSKTPKKSKYLMGASSGIRKSFFVTFCIVLSFILFMVLIEEYDMPEATQTQQEQLGLLDEEDEEKETVKPTTKVKTSPTPSASVTPTPTSTATSTPTPTATPAPIQTIAPVSTESTQNSTQRTAAAGTINGSGLNNDTTTNEQIYSGGTTVYWTDGGKSYHSNPNCPTLSRSKNVRSGSMSSCPKSDPCDMCN